MAQDDYIRTALRVPPELHKQIHEAAAKAGRSFNAELLARLQSSQDSQQLQAVITMQSRLLAYLGGSVAELAKQSPAVGERADAYLKSVEDVGQAFADLDIKRAMKLWMELQKKTAEYAADDAPDTPLPPTSKRKRIVGQGLVALPEKKSDAE